MRRFTRPTNGFSKKLENTTLSGLWRDPADELACTLARRPAGQHDALARQEAHPPMASLTLASSRRFLWVTYLLTYLTDDGHAACF
jgi:hypothetical protein